MDNGFIPIGKKEMEEKGIQRFDFVLITGDAYVDHPSFGAAIIARTLKNRGYSVGIIPQPEWRDKESFKVLGRPSLAFLVTSGNMDSMVNNYTAAKIKRKKDVYSPGEVTGKRPDRAVTVYCNRIRDAYGDVPVIIGGIEASLRRFGHYDYWEDRVKRSVIIDSRADLLVYGMGERQIVEIAESLKGGIDIKHITYIKGTSYKTDNIRDIPGLIMLPGYEEIATDKEKYLTGFMLQHENSMTIKGKPLAERYAADLYVVQNTPAEPLDRIDLDDIYELGYMRTYHPKYEKNGGIKAVEEVRHSIVSSRGCFGRCSFCALSFHQGPVVSSRSQESILKEAEIISMMPDFKGYIHDVGGPTANFRHASCRKQETTGVCVNKQCLYPGPCENLDTDHSEYLELLKKIRSMKGIKKVFIRSGIRYDYLIYAKDSAFLSELCEHHTSGQLKVAPEHVSDKVLSYMSKPSIKVFELFKKEFEKENVKLRKEQYLVPYFMSGHPGSTLEDAIELAEYMRDNKIAPEQVQEFYPTPGTLSTCMYYTGIDPRTMKKVYVAKTPSEKAMQRALLQYHLPKNHQLVIKALTLAGRTDLIGNGKKCLIGQRQRKSGRTGTR